MTTNTYFPILKTSSDTLKIDTLSIQKDTVSKNINTTIDSNLEINTKLNFSKIDSIIKLSEQREKEFDSQKTTIPKPIIYKKTYRPIDTNMLIYKSIGVGVSDTNENSSNIYNKNIFSNFSCIKPSNNKPERVLISQTTKENPDKVSKIKKTSANVQFDWMSIILLISFILIGWVRLFNKKYFFSVIKSAFIYQYSIAIIKGKNTLTGRVSFVFNLVYFLSLSLFIFQIFDFFDINIYGNSPINLFLYIFGFLFFLNIYRFITSKSIAFLFLKEKIFNEYYFNLNLFNKNIGLIIIPFVIVYRFMQIDNYKFVIYSGLILVLFYLFLFIIRSFQIIIKNNTSISYMILYLCAFEIAPLLIIIKLLSY